MSGARRATTTKKPNRPRPATALRFPARPRPTDPRMPRRLAMTGVSMVAWSVTTRTAICCLPLLARARIERRGKEVGRKHGDEHRDREHEEQRLHQRVV